MNRTILRPIILSILLALPALVETTAAPGPPYTWSGPTAVEQFSGIDVLPAGLQAANGTLWLAWQTHRYGPQPEIAYKTMTNGVWGVPERLTTTGQNIQPALSQLNNGTILLFWAYQVTDNLQYKRFSVDSFGVGSWSDTVQLTTTTLDDTYPSSAVGADGTLWLVWTRTNQTDKQLYYKTLKNGVWSPDVKLTSDPNWNWQSSVIVGKDGKVRVVWSKGQNTLNNYQIYQMTYDGAAWSPQTQIVFSPGPDERSSILQDRNGTIWLFWGRQQEAGNVIYYILYNKFSVDAGLTWSSEAQMSFAPSKVTSQTPAAVQSNMGSDKAIRVFFATTLENNYDIWVYNSPSIYPVHDVRILSLNPSTTLQYPGGMASVGQGPIVTMTLVLSNLGDSAETVPVSLIAANTTSYNLGTLTPSIGLGATVILTFSWNTTGAPPGRYRLDATATLAGETVGNAGDSSLVQKNRIHMLPLGDIDQNGAVSLTDVSVFFYDFGFTSTCGCPRWNPFADINNTGIIDIIDVGIAVRNFGIVT